MVFGKMRPWINIVNLNKIASEEGGTLDSHSMNLQRQSSLKGCVDQLNMKHVLDGPKDSVS